MCDIYKRGLLPTTRKQFDLDSTIWALQEDNNPKHTFKLALNWKAGDRIKKIDCPSMSPDLAPIKNVWQLLKMKLRKKSFRSCQSLICAIKRERNTAMGHGYYTCTRDENRTSFVRPVLPLSGQDIISSLDLQDRTGPKQDKHVTFNFLLNALCITHCTLF